MHRRQAAIIALATTGSRRGRQPDDPREPGVDPALREARLEPLGLDGLHEPPVAERRPDLPPRDPPRAASERVSVAPAEEERPAAGTQRRTEARGVARPIAVLERVEEADVDDRVERPAERGEIQRIRYLELDGNVAIRRLGRGALDRGRREVHAQHRVPERGQVERVLAGPAPGVAHRPADAPRQREADERALRSPDVPCRRPAVAVRVVEEPDHPPPPRRTVPDPGTGTARAPASAGRAPPRRGSAEALPFGERTGLS